MVADDVSFFEYQQFSAALSREVNLKRGRRIQKMKRKNLCFFPRSSLVEAVPAKRQQVTSGFETPSMASKFQRD
uniref:Uncharacterized protein n=1 Tax=Physcomitrium patens TaxID=3218 RepID=A0A2K1KKM9_PHYPA|nr:hypothetical protein PHYPA_008015 [Physcomitrium patens]